MSQQEQEKLPLILILALFFVSGALALVYEVVWSRMMMQVFGSTAIAVGTVLAAFMSGMAIGSWFIGKAADHSPNWSPLWRLALPLVLTVAVLTMSRAPLNFQFPSDGEQSYFETFFYREGRLATTKVYWNPRTMERHMSVDDIGSFLRTTSDTDQVITANEKTADEYAFNGFLIPWITTICCATTWLRAAWSRNGCQRPCRPNNIAWC